MVRRLTPHMIRLMEQCANHPVRARPATQNEARALVRRGMAMRFVDDLGTWIGLTREGSKALAVLKHEKRLRRAR